MPEFELTASPSPEDLAIIQDALNAFNTEDVGAWERKPLAVLIRDTDGKVTGGLSGYTAWGWLFTQTLYIPETQRGKGMAGKILAAAEEEAKAPRLPRRMDRYVQSAGAAHLPAGGL